MKTIAILSQKGGAGKTTVAIHLASAAERDGKSVVIADLDPQGSSSDWHTARLKHKGNPLPHVKKTAPAALPGFAAEAERQGVDLLILDTPPKSDLEAVAAVELADLVLMVSTPSVMDLRAMHNTIRLTHLTKLKPGAVVSLVLNRMRPMGTAALEAAEALRGLNTDVMHVGLGNRVAFEYCLIQGESALEYEPEGQAAMETLNFYEQVCKLINMKTTKHKRGIHHGKTKARA